VSAPPPDRLPSPFDDLYGLELLEASAEVMRGRIEVADHHKQPMGLVHGGVYASMAETLASIGTWLGVQEDGNIATGMSNSTTFLRPVTEGEVTAVGRPLHRGRTTWVWDLQFNDARERLVAVSRMTIAVRPASS
jgi:1,4-dihydroxy-2-naphthoyl-CoA hydrolase